MVSFDNTAEETAAFGFSVPKAGIDDGATVLPELVFDLPPGDGSTPSGRFGVFLLVTEALGEEEDDDGVLC